MQYLTNQLALFESYNVIIAHTYINSTTTWKDTNDTRTSIPVRICTCICIYTNRDGCSRFQCPKAYIYIHICICLWTLEGAGIKPTDGVFISPNFGTEYTLAQNSWIGYIIKIGQVDWPQNLCLDMYPQILLRQPVGVLWLYYVCYNSRLLLIRWLTANQIGLIKLPNCTFNDFLEGTITRYLLNTVWS